MVLALSLGTVTTDSDSQWPDKQVVQTWLVVTSALWGRWRWTSVHFMFCKCSYKHKGCEKWVPNDPLASGVSSCWCFLTESLNLWTPKYGPFLWPLANLTSDLCFCCLLLRGPTWPNRSLLPTSSVQPSSRRTALETFSTWPHWPASTKTTKTSNAVKPLVLTRGFHTCPVGPTWAPWPQT